VLTDLCRSIISSANEVDVILSFFLSCVSRITVRVMSRFRSSSSSRKCVIYHNWPILLKLVVMIGPTNSVVGLWSQIRIPDQFSVFLIIAELGILLAFLIQSPPDVYETRQDDWHRLGL